MESEDITTARFVRPPGNAEQVEKYVVGGYHPVHLGDVLNERYCILRKLGNGTFATVWLAKDDIRGEYVALKIVIASGTKVQREINILAKLCSSPDPLAPAQLPVPKLLDSFDLKGPNGVHKVLALELLGSSLTQFITGMGFFYRTDKEYRNIGVLRDFSRQIVYAVHYIHSKGIVHRDIHPGNILFALKPNPDDAIKEADSNYESTHQLCPKICPLRRVDGRPLDAHSPKYVVQPQPLEFDIVDTSLLSDSRLVLSDFGAATTFENSNDGRHAYPVTMRPPEAILGLPISEKSDIWALGCTIFRFMTLTDICLIDPSSKGEKRDDEHLRSMVGVLGPMPARMRPQWTERQRVMDEDGNLLPLPAEDPSHESRDYQLSELMPACRTLEQVSEFESFIRSMIQWEPEDRASAEELLQHRWLTEM